MTRDEILSIFHETRALLEGHFQLSSGLHSPHYFQCAKVLQYPGYAEALCGEIAKRFARESIHAVIAPALGGMVVGQEVGRLLAIQKSLPTLRSMFTERKDGTMQLRRGFSVGPGERLLVCEDVVTTGGSVQEVISLIRAAGGEVVGVGCIVDRSGGRVRFDVPAGSQYAVLHMDTVTYTADACPLCKQGLPVEQPGSRLNR